MVCSISESPAVVPLFVPIVVQSYNSNRAATDAIDKIRMLHLCPEDCFQDSVVSQSSKRFNQKGISHAELTANRRGCAALSRPDNPIALIWSARAAGWWFKQN
jgi:hypothetical protein